MLGGGVRGVGDGQLEARDVVGVGVGVVGATGIFCDVGEWAPKRGIITVSIEGGVMAAT